MLAKVRDAERRCPRERGVPGPTFGPHAIGAERFTTAFIDTSSAQLGAVIQGKQARVENPDKDEAAGSSPARPTTPGLTCGNAHPGGLQSRLLP